MPVCVCVKMRMCLSVCDHLGLKGPVDVTGVSVSSLPVAALYVWV